jgi:hypothetical protein
MEPSVVATLDRTKKKQQGTTDIDVYIYLPLASIRWQFSSCGVSAPTGRNQSRMKKGHGVLQTKANCAGLVRLSTIQDQHRRGIRNRLELRNKTSLPWRLQIWVPLSDTRSKLQIKRRRLRGYADLSARFVLNELRHAALCATWDDERNQSG